MMNKREKESFIRKTLLDCFRQPYTVKKAETAGINTSTGLMSYDLQPAAKLIYPVLSPIRNETPRVKGQGGDSTHWKAIIGINSGRLELGVGEGHRNAVIKVKTEDRYAKYASIGLENNITDEAMLGAQGFDDARALGVRNLLESTIIGEESLLLAGNASLKLGITPTPTVSAATTGGTIAKSTAVSVICVALSYDGMRSASVVDGIRAKVERQNADGTTDTYGGGAAQKSEAATVTTGAGTDTNKLVATVTPVKGAFAYAWLWGKSGEETLGEITTVSTVEITANATGTQKASDLPTEDCSYNELIFDGIMTQVIAGSGYVKTMETGAGLTTDKAAGIVEFDDALRHFWDKYNASPDEILCSAQELNNITNKVIANGGTPFFQLNLDSNGQVAMTAGAVIAFYTNRYSADGKKSIPVKLHPNMPVGTVLFRVKKMPYPVSNVNNVAEVRYLEDYHQTEWPRTRRMYEYGVYSREALAVYAPFLMGIITNIADV